MTTTGVPERMSVSVVVCCHDSRERLPETLGHLAAQVVPSEVVWEVVVVDNASTDGTGAEAERLWPVAAPSPLRVVAEPRPGVAFARRTGVLAAAHDVVSFVDDDNWVDPEWVDRVSRIFTGIPQAAACGAQGSPAYETPPPAWFAAASRWYAIGPQGPEAGPVPQPPGLLWTAGMAVRKSALLSLYEVGFAPQLASRTGGSLASGEDAELSLALRLAGWELHYAPQLHYRHFMPARRMTWAYYTALQRALGAASAVLKHYEIRLDPRFSSSLLLALRNRWWGETLLSVVGLAAAAVQVVLSLGRDSERRARFHFKWGKLRELAAHPRRFGAVRTSVERLVTSLGGRPAAVSGVHAAGSPAGG